MERASTIRLYTSTIARSFFSLLSVCNFLCLNLFLIYCWCRGWL
jgi:hypothetical protein